MITIDGSFGEGGGQILRTSLALSLVTGKAFRIENIRSGRKKPGLMRQHLTAVNAAVDIGQAKVKGNHIRSTEVSFTPGTIKPGNYHFAVGTAGSTTLVLQTILPALLIANGKSEIVLEGGTHNPYSPPFDFLQKVFAPIINRMGAELSVSLERPGFYPAGGGKFNVMIEPTGTLHGVDILERGQVKRRLARAIVSQLPEMIGQRELKVIGSKLSWDGDQLLVETVRNSRGPGNILMVEIESDNITELLTAFGAKGIPARRVGQQAATAAKEYLAGEVPVGRHLADQLMIPLAMAGGGKFRTLPLTRHSTTNIEILKKFLDVKSTVTKLRKDQYEVEIRPL